MNRRHFAAYVALTSVGSIFAVAGAFAAVSTEKFVKTAGIAGMFEIESSEIALTKTQSANIKAFAEKMIRDHTMAAAELSDIAKGKYKMPKELDAKHQTLIKQLNESSEPDFDKLYAKMQTQAHQEAVGLFGDYASSGNEATIKQFAAKTLPILEEHYSMIKMIDAKMTS